MLGVEPLTLEAIAAVARAGKKVQMSAEARARIDAARRVVDRIQDGGDAAPAVYGVNTGFGFLADVRISRRRDPQPAAQPHPLARRRRRAAAAGAASCARMMLLRAQVLSLGHSGVRAVVCELLLRDAQSRRAPGASRSKGSVGASGDLAPLAHLALVVIGEGEAFARRQAHAAAIDALAQAGLSPVRVRGQGGHLRWSTARSA